MKRRASRSLIVVAMCAAMLMSIALPAAMAGEIAGNGTRITVQGQSECAFSGQNDEFHEEEGTWPRVQSFGQIVRFAGPIGGVPGFACNPSGKR